MRPVKRGQHAEVDQAAGAAVEPLTGPPLTPAVLGHKPLDRCRELTRTLHRGIDVIRAEHLAAHRESVFVAPIGPCHLRSAPPGHATSGGPCPEFEATTILSYKKGFPLAG